MPSNLIQMYKQTTWHQRFNCLYWKLVSPYLIRNYFYTYTGGDIHTYSANIIKIYISTKNNAVGTRKILSKVKQIKKEFEKFVHLDLEIFCQPLPTCIEKCSGNFLTC